VATLLFRRGLSTTQDAADGPGDIGRRERRRRGSVEQRPEAVMVPGVDEQHFRICAGPSFGRFKAAEAPSDNQDARSVLVIIFVFVFVHSGFFFSLWPSAKLHPEIAASTKVGAPFLREARILFFIVER
jgi:hypothetical protein